MGKTKFIEGTVCSNELSRIFSYNEISGELSWKERGKSRVVGAAAGGPRPDGYMSVSVKGVRMQTHRVIWCMCHGSWPSEQIDHIDGNRSNNRISNLRSASQVENGKNQKAHSDNTSGIPGVYWHKKAQKWMAAVGVAGGQKYLGLYLSMDDAADVVAMERLTCGFSPRHGS